MSSAGPCNESDADGSGARPSRTSLLCPKQAPPPFAAQVDLLGVPVARTRFDDLRDWFVAAARARRRSPSVLFFADADVCNLAWRDPDYRSLLSRADVVVASGAAMKLYGAVAGASDVEPLGPAELFSRLFEEAGSPSALRVFLLGATAGRLTQAAARIAARFAHVAVAGTHAGDGESAIESVNEACADVLLVDAATGEAERWIDENQDLLDVGVVASAGAFVDSLMEGTGTPRPPTLLGRAAGAAKLFAHALGQFAFGAAPRDVPF